MALLAHAVVDSVAKLSAVVAHAAEVKPKRAEIVREAMIAAPITPGTPKPLHLLSERQTSLDGSGGQNAQPADVTASSKQIAMTFMVIPSSLFENCRRDGARG